MISLARNWWLFVLRGVLLVLFALAALIWPSATLVVLVLWIGAAFLVNGIFALAAAAGRDVEGRGWLVLEGLLGIAAGVLTFFYPGITQVVLLAIVAAWAVVTGLIEIVVAIRLRRVIHGEWLLGLAGVLAVAFGVILVVWPLAGLITLALLIGWFAMLYGAALIALGIRLRALWKGIERGTGEIPAGL